MSTYLMMAMAVVAALLFLNQATRQKVMPDRAGRFHLRMNKLYSLAGIFGILLGLGLSVTGLMREISIEMTGLVLVILGITWGPGITCLLYYYNHRVTIDDTSITVTNVFRQTVSLRWEEMTSAHANNLSGFITIRGAGRKVKIHQHLVGIAQLIGKLTEKKGWTIPPFPPVSTPGL